MKKSIYAMLAGLSMLAAVATSCSNPAADQKVSALLEGLNSEKFKEEARATNWYTDASAEIVGDTLVVTFEAVPGLRFSNSNRMLVDGQRKAMAEHLRAGVAADPVLREGFEGLRDNKMGYKVLLRDTQGGTASVVIDPEDVLGKEE